MRRELARLPEQQRIVVSLRDVDGYDSDEVCALLDLTAANQRVLLHRGRARIRRGARRLLRGGLMTDWDDVDFGGMTCREFVELVTEYLEDRLDAGTRAPVRAARRGVPRLRALPATRSATTRDALGRVELDTISPGGARDQLLTAFRTWRVGTRRTSRR